ncbi:MULTISPECIES: MFS transporter [Francisella]|uniref:Lysosomal dipeptide transporter MFSD1 n=1 Tax=Francisella opportunistica TaxID=2016517 RepID=A0A345JPH9_9GAMM|nr:MULTISPECIES: MFS transporter [Francisella]APC90897.1 Major facilitator superfamily (MFS) transport protein [Francisella sp. MA067296]AXH29225.1 MFS transporter [Francisella opportunistica]AXH30876.1 MFS transporter [Francisella opportunistica]AXH32521.1 MFS transporter [Francisella opportunistica]
MYKTKITSLGLSIWFICAFFYALEYFVRSSTGALLDGFMKEPYNLNIASTALFSSSFYWSYIVSQIPAGIIVDKFGVKKVMTFSSVIFSIAMLIATIAYSEPMLLVYRILAGFGGGFAILCAIKSIAIWLPNRLFPAFTGLTQFVLYIGATLSAAPLVFLSKYLSISQIMALIFIVSFVLLLSSIFVIKTHPDYKKENKYNNKQNQTLKDILAVLKNKQIWFNGLFCFTIYGTTVLFADLWGIRYLTLYGFTQNQAGFCTSLIFIGVCIFSPIWGVIASAVDSEKKFLLISPIFGFFIVTYLLFFNENIIIAYILCVLFGGVQAVHVLNYSALRNTVSVTQIATGLAIVNMFLPLSGGVLQPITGAMITYLKKTHEALYAFQTTLIIIPILMVLSFIIALFIKDSSS